MVSDHGPTRPARDQQNGDDERRKRQARWYHRGVTITAVNERIQQREQNGEHVTHRVRPSQRAASFAAGPGSRRILSVREAETPEGKLQGT